MSVHLGMASGKWTLLNKFKFIRNSPHNILKRLADEFSVQKANWESLKAELVFLLQVTAKCMSFIVIMCFHFIVIICFQWLPKLKGTSSILKNNARSLLYVILKARTFDEELICKMFHTWEVADNKLILNKIE